MCGDSVVHEQRPVGAGCPLGRSGRRKGEFECHARHHACTFLHIVWMAKQAPVAPRVALHALRLRSGSKIKGVIGNLTLCCRYRTLIRLYRFLEA
jgi:hypothetical protein